MARIEHLNKSITEMEEKELDSLIHSIRANRRIRPTKTVKVKKQNAAAKRAKASKRAPKQQDIFKMVEAMSAEQKAKIAVQLLGK